MLKLDDGTPFSCIRCGAQATDLPPIRYRLRGPAGLRARYGRSPSIPADGEAVEMDPVAWVVVEYRSGRVESIHRPFRYSEGQAERDAEVCRREARFANLRCEFTVAAVVPTGAPR